MNHTNMNCTSTKEYKQITLLNISYINVLKLYQGITILGYLEHKDFLLNTFVRFLAMELDKVIPSIDLFIYNNRMLEDPKLKELLLEYII